MLWGNTVPAEGQTAQYNRLRESSQHIGVLALDITVDISQGAPCHDDPCAQPDAGWAIMCWLRLQTDDVLQSDSNRSWPLD